MVSVTNHFKNLLKGDRIADREIFMKGIDCSYYFEQEEQSLGDTRLLLKL